MQSRAQLKVGQTPGADEIVRGMCRITVGGHARRDVVVSLRTLLNGQDSCSPDFRHQEESLEALVGICTTALDAVASPLCAVCSDGRLLFANSAARCSLHQGRWLESYGGRINTASQYDAAPTFESALARLRSGTASTLLLTHRRNGHQAVATVAPIWGENRDDPGSSECLGLVWLATNESDQAPVKHLAQLFNLTPAEQNLLSALAGGMGLREAAAHLNVSIHTTRNQLKSILSKTGRHSQAQLMSLVTRMASLRFADPA